MVRMATLLMAPEATAGFRCVRVNRASAPDEYGLNGRVPEVADLAGLADRL